MLSYLFRKEMGDKPYLQIEVDEHFSPVGVITRIEAFLQSLEGCVDGVFSGPQSRRRIGFVVRKYRQRVWKGCVERLLPGRKDRRRVSGYVRSPFAAAVTARRSDRDRKSTRLNSSHSRASRMPSI